MFYFSAPAINTIIATVSVNATMDDGKETFWPNRIMWRLMVSWVDEGRSIAGGIVSSNLYSLLIERLWLSSPMLWISVSDRVYVYQGHPPFHSLRNRWIKSMKPSHFNTHIQCNYQVLRQDIKISCSRYAEPPSLCPHCVVRKDSEYEISRSLIWSIAYWCTQRISPAL